ncbi:MAG: RusA family crossover junction endodeoxyribonuclease [Nitrospinaceae bacterium]
MSHQMEPIIIEVTGKPIPWARTGGGKNTGRFTPANVRAWKEAAGWLAREAMKGRKPLNGCITLFVLADFLIPASWPEWKREAALEGRIEPTGKPDLDNLVKNVKDALNNIVWIDDAQVVREIGLKQYSEHPMVRIEVIQRATSPSNIKRREQLEGK